MNHRITLSGKLKDDGRDRIDIFTPDNYLLASVYVSPGETKLRVVLPELESFAQVKIDIDKAKNGFIDFERNAAEARRSVRKVGG